MKKYVLLVASLLVGLSAAAFEGTIEETAGQLKSGGGFTQEEGSVATTASIAPLFTPDVIGEYQTLRLPFTLAISRTDVESAFRARELPMITNRQQTLGFNGWPCSSCLPSDANNFHDSGQTWSDHIDKTESK